MPARREERDLPAREVGRGNGAFFAAGEDGDYAAEGGGALEEREEVADEAGAGVVD